MSKKLTRNIILCIFVFMAAMLIFFIGYKIAYKNSVDRVRSTFSQAGQAGAAEAGAAADVISPDYFVARYDGMSLSVYSVSDGKEEFLYTLKVRIEDISENELHELKKGITLPTKQALASFEEDFTS